MRVTVWVFIIAIGIAILLGQCRRSSVVVERTAIVLSTSKARMSDGTLQCVAHTTNGVCNIDCRLVGVLEEGSEHECSGN